MHRKVDYTTRFHQGGQLWLTDCVTEFLLSTIFACKQDARIGDLFDSFPPVLQLHLKRFEYDFERDIRLKVISCFLAGVRSSEALLARLLLLLLLRTVQCA